MDHGVVFSFDEFNGAYPELHATDTQAEHAFNLATQLVDNTDSSILTCVCDRKQLLYLATAHVLFLMNRGAGNTGKLTSASEGSVSVGFSAGSYGDDFWGQTQYGLLFWQMTSIYRKGFYVGCV